MTAAGKILAFAKSRPDAIAIDPVVGSRLSYRQLADEVAACTRALLDANCNGRDGPVVLEGDYCADQVVRELAWLAAGVPVLALPAVYAGADRDRVIRDFRARPFGDASRAHAQGMQSDGLAPAGLVRTVYAPGAAGLPKLMSFGADTLLTVAENAAHAIGHRSDCRHLAVLPSGVLLETVAGMFATLLAGGTYVCPRQACIGMADPLRPQYPVLAAFVAQHRITSLNLVPELLAGLVDAMAAMELRLADLSIVTVAGGRVSPAVLVRARQLGLPVRQGYSQTEAGSIVALESVDGDPLGAVGRVLPHLRASVARNGEVLLDSPQDHVPRASSLLHTGDLGYLDQAGRLWIEGHVPGVIVTNHGHRVASEWLEQQLLAQPGVAHAMVYGDGLPMPRALLVPSSPLSDLDAAVTAANAQLPAYARIALWQEISPIMRNRSPSAAGGTLDRRAISAQWLDGEPGFFVRLEAATVRQRLLLLAMTRMYAGVSGTIGRSTYLAYLGQVYHHLRDIMAIGRMMRRQLADRPALVMALDSYEANHASCKAAIFKAVVDAGGHAAIAFEPDPDSAAGLAIAHARRESCERNPLAFVGMAFAMESVGMALVQYGASALAAGRDPPAEALMCFASPDERDRKPVRLFEHLVNSIVDPVDQTAVVAMARTAFGFLGVMFTAIAQERERDDCWRRDTGFAQWHRRTV